MGAALTWRTSNVVQVSNVAQVSRLASLCEMCVIFYTEPQRAQSNTEIFNVWFQNMSIVYGFSHRATESTE